METNRGGYFVNTYLDSPIISTGRNRDYLNLIRYADGERLGGRTLGFKKIVRWFQAKGSRPVALLEPENYEALIPLIPLDDFEDSLKESWETAETLARSVNRGLRKWGLSTDIEWSRGSFSDIPEWGKDALFRSMTLSLYIDKVSSARALGIRGPVEVTQGDLTLVGDEYSLMLVLRTVNEVYILSYEQLLMFKDMFYTWFNISVTYTVTYGRAEGFSEIKSCISWCLHCLTVYKNAGYELAGMIEDITKANIIRVNEAILNPEDCFGRIVDAMRKKEEKLSGSATPQTEAICALLRRQRPLTLTVELFGLQKMFGHPLLDPTIAGKKVRREIAARLPVMPTAVTRVRNSFCRLYLEGYIRRLSQWPPLNFPPETRSTRLYQLYSTRESKLSEGSYDLEDWTGVTFGKHLDFEFYPNFTDLMDDRSISYYRDEAHTTWDKSHTPRSDKRLLIELLSRPVVSIEEIVRRVQVWDIPDSWRIVSLYPKEREFKMEARLFAMMVFEMRAFFAASEGNIADNIFPSIPPQTMTLSKTEKQELFLAATSLSNREDMIKMYWEFDIASWNLHWDARTADAVGQDFSDMHGEPNTFNVVHHFFEKCVMMVRVADCEPPGVREVSAGADDCDVIQSDLMWTGHEPGIEGIFQKGWSSLTYAAADLAVRKHGFKYHLIGQGDNQILVADIDCSGVADRVPFLTTIADSVISDMDEEFRKVGQKLKPTECMVSTSSVTYSKDVYIRSIEYYTTLKACSRIFPHSASDFPSISNSVGALSGSLTAASEQMCEPHRGYFLWMFHTSLYLVKLKTKSPVESVMLNKYVREGLTRNRILALMSIPSCLGGLNISGFFDYLYKGGSDPTSKSVASYKLISNFSPLLRRVTATLEEGLWFSRSPDKEAILDDPFSLPLGRAISPEMAVQSRGARKVHSLSQNHDIRQLMSEKVEDYDKRLVDSLSAVTPFNPILLSDIRSFSIVGARRAVSKMFTATRTIQALLQGDSESNPCSIILGSGTSGFLNLTRRLDNLRPIEKKIDKVYDWVEKLRSRWRSSGESPVVGVTTYQPVDFPLVSSPHVVGCKGIKTFARIPEGEDGSHFRGHENPYLGKRTQEKRSQHGYRIVTSSSPEKAIKKLADIITQPGVGESMKTLISKVAMTRANVDLARTSPFLGDIYGGSSIHRYGSRLGYHTASTLGITGFATNCTISTDDAPPISGGEEDKPVMVQEQMVATLALANMEHVLNGGNRFICLRTDTFQLVDISDSGLMNSPEAPEEITPFLENHIAYAREIYLRRVFSSNETPLTLDTEVPADRPLAVQYALRRIIARSLQGRGSAMSIADTGGGRVNLHIDILEMRGCSLELAFQEAGKEIASLAVEAMFSRSHEDLRWTPIPFVLSVSTGVARSLLPALYHPFFKGQYSDKLGVGLTGLSYKVGLKGTLEKVRDLIASYSIRYLSDPTTGSLLEVEIFFSDDRVGTASTLLTRKLLLLCYASMCIGEITALDGYSIARRTLPANLRLLRTEEAKVNALYRVFVALSVWARTRGAGILCDGLETLIEGRLIRRCNVPGVEVLRLARLILPPELVSPESISEVASADGQLPVEAIFLNNRDPREKTPALSEACWRLEEDKRDIDLFSMRRMVGREYGFESSAGYSYLGLTSIFSKRTVINVGCGFGSGASVMLMSGASMVFGSDLDSDLDIRTVMNGGEDPPAIRHLRLGAKFQRIAFEHGSGGDVTRLAFMADIRRYVGAGALFVVDVPLSERTNTINTLQVLSSYGPNTEVLIRIIMSQSRASSLVEWIANSSNVITFRPVVRHDRFVEGWIHSKLSGRMKDKLKPTDWDRIPQYNSDYTGAGEWMGGGKEYIMRTLYGPLYGSPTDYIALNVQRASLLVSASIGQEAHRFSYSQWTEILHIWMCSGIVSSNYPLQLIEEVLDLDVVRADIAGISIDVRIGTQLRRTLTRVLSRIF
jgi:hypothetical protein